MLSTLLTLALAPAFLGADDTLTSGTLLSFRGSVAHLGDDHTPAEPEKTFDLTLLLAGVGAADGRAYWRIEERGKGAWPWVERFGSVYVDDHWQPSADTGPALLYDRGDGTSVIPLTLPFFAAEQPLADGATWESDPWTYQVEKADPIEGREVWRVAVSNSYGPKRTLWVSRTSPLIASLTERVFMGMGQEYELQLRLIGVEQLADDRRDVLIAQYDALLDLRSKLNREPRTEDRDWNEKQLALLAEDLPAVEQAVTDPSLLKLVKAARRDLDLQNGRADDVAQLSADFEGKPVEKFALEGASRESVSEADLTGQVTVLHFWDYREPLKEPYGQVGYLDFLYHRRKDAGVQVYGIAVDGRLAEEETKGAAVRGIRKVKTFMNLSYPVLLDDGKLLKQFGDPRILGAELPLFVVIDREGTIAHYHVGFYEVDRNEGLKALDSVVGEVLDAKP